MRGINKDTGKALEGMDHLRQSIIDIFTTRIGTRVMRRDYGSEIPNLIDNPVNDTFAVDLYVAAAEAIDLWEPRITLREASMTVLAPGVIDFSLTGTGPDGTEITLDGIVVK